MARTLEEKDGVATKSALLQDVVVVGAGIMGRGIALASARAGYKTSVIEPDAGALQSARAEIEKILDRSREKGEIDEPAARTAREKLTYSGAYGAAKGADLAIEAVPESVAIKAEVYRNLAPLLAPNGVLATNTSSLSITELAATSDRPARFLGMHFFNPVHRMRLLELVRGLETPHQALPGGGRAGRGKGKENSLVPP